MLGGGTCFCRLLISFFKITFYENEIRNTIKESNSKDPEQARHFVGPDLGPNCLQNLMLSADDTSRQIFAIKLFDKIIGGTRCTVNPFCNTSVCPQII